MLAREERDALIAVDRELEGGQTKLKGLAKKFNENVDTLSKAREDILSLLSQSQTLAFLQASFNLPSAVNFEPHTPRINLDSKKILTLALLRLVSLCCVGDNGDGVKYEKAGPGSTPASSGSTGSQPESEVTKPPKQKRAPRSHSPGRPLIQPFFQPAPGGQQNYRLQYPSGPFREQKPPQATEANMGKKDQARSMENLLEFGGNDIPGGCKTSDIPPNITSAEKRTELLKYGTILTLDPKTAHKRIALSEGFTKASVSDEHTNYPDCPERFAVCSQVLASKGFSRGRHYWEVRLSSSNFIGVGLAYSSIDRKGPTSRLGRNAQSWCVEWFNVKLSAWYNSSETVLVNPNPKRIGVLLDCEEGTATFYNVADRAYPFHSFVFPFAEAVYPAFWIFSSGSSISLCKLQA
ncbi:hypothetical protein FQN60_011625 [Etheostoma spectabile]|uniref:RING-type E3 ubiquitin transferase n=1 Tax=Etheostoma spectabile TaxID=54343 RepID=A0A5J5DMI8_9PERO|nr:hypothetical protein FQN60_011625 [Etheostoma spectabile]